MPKVVYIRNKNIPALYLHRDGFKESPVGAEDFKTLEAANKFIEEELVQYGEDEFEAIELFSTKED